MNIDVKFQLLSALENGRKLKQKLIELMDEYNAKFNIFWGQLFKAGHQDSRFAKQVMEYACLYTSRASNLAFIYPDRSFRPVQDFMPHDQMLIECKTDGHGPAGSSVLP